MSTMLYGPAFESHCRNSGYMKLFSAGVRLPAGDGHRPAVLQGLCQQEECAGRATS